MWTIGHSTRSLETLLDFNTDALARDLPAAGLAYTHRPGLGGFRRPRRGSRNAGWRHPSFRGYADYMETDEFAAELDALLDEARATPTAIMCAEAVPWRCHRLLISDALVARGVEVRHILGPAPAEPHVLTAGARVAALDIAWGVTAVRAR